MRYNEDFKKFADSKSKCKTCKFYDKDNENLKLENIFYYGMVAICVNNMSGRNKVGKNTIQCEFYESKGE